MVYGGRGPTINGVLWAETVVAAFFVFAKIYTRRFILRTHGWDDLFLFLAWAFLAAYAACITVGTLWGVGQLRANIPSESYIQAMKFEVIGQGVCIFNIVISKAAISFLLLRIVTRTWHKIFVWFCFITVGLIATWCTIAIFIQCFPIAKLWNPSIEGECWLDFARIGLATSAYACVMDFALATIPCFIVKDLNMKAKDKIITICGLSLGIFAGVCGIMRTVALTSLNSFDEYVYDTSDMLIYSGTENFVFCLCASIPVLRPLWTKMVHSYGTSKDEGYQLSDRQNGTGEIDRANRNTRGGAGSSGPGPGLETRIYANAFGAANSSDEAILTTNTGGGGSPKAVEVTRSTEIMIQYSDMKGQHKP